jgi:hypothetical protein
MSEDARTPPLRFGTRYGVGALYLIVWLSLGPFGVSTPIRAVLMLGGRAFWFSLSELEKSPLT